jgi:5-methylcytosine-specific restriction enzyme subunit McrC
MDRLTRAYEPALRLIGVLLQDAGPSLEGGGSTLPLDGFLFDMNVFFESLLDRFLSENLPGCRVHLQHRLTDMFTWQNEGANRRRRPSPRPDYVVVQPGGSLAVLDAKYRDLSRDLPREMFYQLTMYSMCHGAGNLATILYPSMAVGGRDDRLRIQDPVSRDHLATVVLRPVPLPTLAALLVEGTGGRATATARYELARRLAFGAA